MLAERLAHAVVSGRSRADQIRVRGGIRGPVIELEPRRRIDQLEVTEHHRGPTTRIRAIVDHRRVGRATLEGLRARGGREPRERGAVEPARYREARELE